DRGALPLPHGLLPGEVRLRGGDGRTAVPDHLRLHAGAEDPLRQGRGGRVTTAAQPLVPPRALEERARRIVVYSLLLAISALYFVPFLWSLSTSFKTLPDTAYFSLLPHHWLTVGYHDVLTKYDFKRYMLNSAFLAAVITASTVFLPALGGYAFARLRFPGPEV